MDYVANKIHSTVNKFASAEILVTLVIDISRYNPWMGDVRDASGANFKVQLLAMYSHQMHWDRISEAL